MGRSSRNLAIVQKEPAPSTALATTNTITRSAANEMLRARSVELFQEARQAQNQSRIDFESKYGAIDRIDESLLRELQAMQLRFAAIAARQKTTPYGEPKASKFVTALGSIIGEISVHLATERAVTLFTPINESDFIGYNGRIGAKGLDESVLAQYTIIDDVPAPTKDELDETCLHVKTEPVSDDETRIVCMECDEEFPQPSQEVEHPK